MKKAKLWCRGLLLSAILLLFLPMITALSVHMISNTPFCLGNCETIYEICKEAPKDADLSFDLKFYDPGAQEIQRTKEIYLLTDKEISQDIPVYETKSVTREILDNKTGKMINQTAQEITIKSYTAQISSITQYDKADPKDLSALPECSRISVKGQLKPGEAVDNVLKIGDIEYKEFAWWNATFTTRYLLNCSNSHRNSYALSDFTLNSTQTIIWFMCQTPDNVYLYYNNASIFAVGNETSALPFEVVKGIGSSYNVSQLWALANLVEHFGNKTGVKDSTGKNPDASGTATYRDTSGIDGAYYFSSSYLSITNNDTYLNSTIATFCAYFNTTQGAGIGHMITKPAHSSWTAPYASFSLSNYNWNDMNLQATISGTERNLVFDTGWASNTYNLLCGIYDGITLRNSLNGVLNETGAYSSALSGTDAGMPLIFGQRLVSVTTEQFIGLIDEFFYFPSNISSIVVTDLYNALRKNAGYGNLGAIELNNNHVVEFSNQPPNITIAKGESIFIQQNASCSLADPINYSINNTAKFNINISGYLTNKSLGVNRGFFPLSINASDQNGSSILGLFFVNLTCDPLYSCLSYGSCNGANITPCLNVTDPWCNDLFTGNISTYDLTCACNSTFICSNLQPCDIDNTRVCLNVSDTSCGRDYLGSAEDYNQVCAATTPTMTTIDLTQNLNVILFGLFLFFWLGLAVLTFTFRNFAFGSLMFFIGCLLGFWSFSISWILSAMFLLFSALIWMRSAKFQ